MVGGHDLLIWQLFNLMLVGNVTHTCIVVLWQWAPLTVFEDRFDASLDLLTFIDSNFHKLEIKGKHKEHKELKLDNLYFWIN